MKVNTMRYLLAALTYLLVLILLTSANKADAGYITNKDPAKVYYSCQNHTVPQYTFEVYGVIGTEKGLITVTDSNGPASESAAFRSVNRDSKIYHRFDFGVEKDGSYGFALIVDSVTKNAILIDYTKSKVGKPGKPILVFSCAIYL